jgi:uncharacterized protein
MTMVRMLAIVGLMTCAAGSAWAEDCSRPKTPAERLICSNDRVSDAREQMTVAFFLAYRRLNTDERRAQMRDQQQAFEAKVRDGCLDVPCILEAYSERTLELEQN